MPSNSNSDQSVGKLKLIHIVYGLVAAAIVAGMAFGAIKNQQEVNTQEIQKKVNVDLFEMQEKQQTERYDQINRTMEKGFDKMDKAIESIKG